MKLKFRHKVFLTFLLYSVAIVICMLAVAGYFAGRNFQDYIDKMEGARLTQLAEAVGREYEASGGWGPVAAGWHSRPDEAGTGQPGERLTRLMHHSPPSSRFPGAGPASGQGPGPEKPAGPPPAFDAPPLPPAMVPPGPPMAEPRLSLLDADRRLLAGNELSPPDAYRLEPVTVNGQSVGWVAMESFTPRKRPLDVEFLARQSTTFYAVGGIALLMAGFVTFWLSRHLLAPLKELASGTRALTRRRFETRIEVRTEDEFGQLAADFNNMARALGRYEQMRRQWIADIAHELRTPLAVLRGEIEAMQDGVREVTPEALDSLHFEVLHVGRIVHDLHDLSLIESGAMEEERIFLNPLDVLEETVRSFHTRFARRGIAIESKDGCRVEVVADPDRLKQLFSNLLENTLRYADAPGKLKIDHTATAERLELHFEDSGPGVPEESLGRLFDRLYRVDKARSRDKGGSGLGLAICKGIVESFGGTIEASNGSLGGLRVTVSFPLPSGGATKTGGVTRS